MNTPTFLLCAAVSLHLLAAPAQAADDAALQRCRAIPEAGPRLACYDALPLRAAALPAATPAPPAGPAPGVVPAATATASAPAVAPAAATATATAATAAAARFGQESRDEPQTLSTHIAGTFEGWGPRSRIKLANGQVWQVIDGSEGVYLLQSPKVTVRRALMGGFLLDIAGANKTPKVRRVE